METVEHINQALRLVNAILAFGSIPFSAMVLYMLIRKHKDLETKYEGLYRYLAFFFIVSCFVGGISGLLSFYLYISGLGFLDGLQIPDGAIIYNLRNLAANILIFTTAYSAWRFQRAR